MVWARPAFNGSAGWVRSSAWVWLFSSTDKTRACSGGFIYSPHDGFQFLGEVGVPTDFESLNQVRLQTMSMPNTAHAGFADAYNLRHGPCAPMGGVAGVLSNRSVDPPFT